MNDPITPLQLYTREPNLKWHPFSVAPDDAQADVTMLMTLMKCQTAMEHIGVETIIAPVAQTDQQLNERFDRFAKMPLRNLYVKPRGVDDGWFESPGGNQRAIQTNLEHVSDWKEREGWDTVIGPPGMSGNEVEALWVSRN